MPLNSVYRLSVVGDCVGQTIVNTFHFQQKVATLPLGISGPAEVIRLFTTGPVPTPMTAYLGCLPQPYTIRELVVGNPNDPLDNGGAQVAGTGQRVGSAMCPPQCCSLLSLRTIGRGRSYRGRTFIGPVLEADQDNGVITTGYQASLNFFISSMNNSFTGVTMDWVVYSKLLNVALRVQTIIIRNFIATQRRRSRYSRA